MKEKSLYLASAVVSALSFVAADSAMAEYDAQMKHCYGAAKAGHNDCAPKGNAHSCKGQTTESCSQDDWKMAMSEEECGKLVKKCQGNASDDN